MKKSDYSIFNKKEAGNPENPEYVASRLIEVEVIKEDNEEDNE